MTHDDRVLQLLADGEPHSHLAVYDLRVVAHSRIASLRKKGHHIECWKADGVYWYVLVSEGQGLTEPDNGGVTSPDAAVPLADEHGQSGARVTAATLVQQPVDRDTDGWKRIRAACHHAAEYVDLDVHADHVRQTVEAFQNSTALTRTHLDGGRAGQGIGGEV